MSDQDTATTEWFDSVIGSDSGREASNKTGIPRMTLQRIRTGENLKAEQVIAVARAYNYPTVQALVTTGFLRKDEAFSSNMRSTLTDASDLNLSNEILRRLQNGQAGEWLTGTPDTP